MADLDDRLQRLRDELRSVGAGDFRDVLARRHRLIARRLIAAVGIAILTCGGIAWAALATSGQSVLHEQPAAPLPGSPSPSAGSDASQRAAALAAERAHQLALAEPQPCVARALKATANGNGAWPGRATQGIRLTNISATGCALNGYPSIDAVTSRGAVIALHATHEYAPSG